MQARLFWAWVGYIFRAEEGSANTDDRNSSGSWTVGPLMMGTPLRVNAVPSTFTGGQNGGR